MGFRRLYVVLGLVALIATAAPASAGLNTAALKPQVDKAVITHLAGHATADVVIGYRSRPTAADITALRIAGFTGPFLTYEVVDGIAATATTASLKAIASNPRISRVEYDSVIPYTLDRATTVGRAKHAWGANYELGNTLHTGGITGRGVTVAVIDSGIDGRHPDLREKTLAKPLNESPTTIGNFSVLGRSIANMDAAILDPEDFDQDAPLDSVFQANNTAIPNPVSDNGGHGTHVSGIVAGRGKASGFKYKGVAPGAKLLGLASGEVLVVSRGLAAMDFLHLHHAEYGVRVVNNSWGGAGEYDPTSLMTKAIERLSNQDGLIMVFSAGNDSGDGSAVATSLWANIPSVISVANYYDRTGWVDLSSSRGQVSKPETWPLVAAPGTDIISTAMTAGGVTYYGTAQDFAVSQLEGTGEPLVVPAPLPKSTQTSAGGQSVVVGDYTSMTGTSMASPFIAGVCALILEANPGLNGLQVKEILAKTANMVPGKSYAANGFEIGHGVVDATEAIAVALRMRDGDATVDTAISNASIDYTSNPVSINTGTGPVSDNSIPLFPILAQELPVTGTGHIYQGGALDAFGLAGAEKMVAGTPVQFAARALHSNSSAITLGLNTFSFEFTLLRGTTRVAGPFTAINDTDSADYQSSYDYQVPAGMNGKLHLQGELHYGADIYRVFDIPVEVVKP